MMQRSVSQVCEVDKVFGVSRLDGSILRAGVYWYVWMLGIWMTQGVVS